MKNDIPHAVPFNLEPGTNVFLEPAGLNGQRVKTLYVGMVRGRYIVFTLPSSFGDKTFTEALHPGNKIRIIYALEGNMYAFQVDLIAAQTRPFPQVYLKYPEQIECFNLRKYNRAECHLYAVVEVGGDGLQALIGDISVGGCRIAINLGKLDLGYTPVFTVGDLVDLNFTLDDLEHRVVLCEVKNVRSDSSVIHLGLAFMEAEDDLKEAIQNFVDNLMMFQE